MKTDLNENSELEQIKKLSNQEIVASLHTVFENERRITRTALLHLKVIQDRRVFAERGFESLFYMLVKEYKLSETSANQRLKALALLNVVPDCEESLVNGEVNLTTLALAQRQIKREEKITGEKVSVAKKIEIAEQIKNKTQNETEIELMRLLPNTASCPKTHERRISENMVRVSHNIPDRLRDKLKRLQEIWAHVNPTMDDIETIERSVDDTLSRIDPLLKKNRKNSKATVGSKVTDSKTGVNQKPQTDDLVIGKTQIRRSVAHKVGIDRVSAPKRPAYFSVQTRQILWQRAGSCCEYLDEVTGRRCSSKFALEKDHVIPIAMGGTNDISNLRLLCQVHNGFMARKWFGDEKIDREIRKSSEMVSDN